LGGESKSLRSVAPQQCFHGLLKAKATKGTRGKGLKKSSK